MHMVECLDDSVHSLRYLVQPEIVQAPVWSSCLLPGGLCCLPGVAEAPLEQPWEPAGERELLWEQALAAELHRSYLRMHRTACQKC